MKKYFVRETEEQIEFGDVVNLTFFKKLEDGKVNIEKEVEFNENTMDLLIEMSFVEEREVEEEEDNTEGLLDFDEQELEEAWNELLEEIEDHDKRIENLESLVKTLKACVRNIQKSLKKETAKPVEGK